MIDCFSAVQRLLVLGSCVRHKNSVLDWLTPHVTTNTVKHCPRHSEMKTTIPVAGLVVHVHTQDGIDLKSGRPVAAVFLLHGRLGEAQSTQIDGLATSILSRTRDAGQTQSVAKDLIVVTFDHRNHGTRLVEAQSNEGWARKGKGVHNAKHAIDMFAIQTGTARDVSFLIDFLPAYLYPDGESQIVDWEVIGISLGGHSVWIVLTKEPRVSLGIPIIGCPDFLSLMEGRAKASGIPLTAPYLPDSLRTYIKQHSPTATSYDTTSTTNNPFLKKDILVLSGAVDKLVPWECSRPFVEALVVGEYATKRVVLQEGAGHEVTPEMQTHAADFVWRWLSNADGSRL